MNSRTSEKFSTIIFSKQAQLKDLLTLYLRELNTCDLIDGGLDFSDIYNTVSSLEKTLLVIDLENYDDKFYDFIQKLTTDIDTCKVIAICENPKVEDIVKIMRVGAKEIISSPVIKNNFVEAINRVYSQFNEDNSKITNSRLITVFSNKGGIGKTSVASNVALELARITKENVALVDLNFQLGDITTFLDIKPSFNISYMLQNLNKLNKDFLLNTLDKYKDTNLFVLADPQSYRPTEKIIRTQIQQLLEILKTCFSYIVVDTDSNLDNKNVTVLDSSDVIFLVTTANLPVLRNTQRSLGVFNKLGYNEEKIHVILNRFMENDEIKVADIEKLLKKSVYWKIPNNYFSVIAAINKGVPVCEVNPQSNVSQSYRQLAIYLADTIQRQQIIRKIIPNSRNNLDEILRG